MINEENLIEKQKSSELIYDGKVLHLYKDEIILPDGSSRVVGEGEYVFYTKA